MRLLIIILLAYFAYRAIKSWMHKNLLSAQSRGNVSSNQVDDIMVKDPQCGMYFPKNSGIRTVHRDQEIYFCSEKCRDEFLSGSENSSE